MKSPGQTQNLNKRKRPIKKNRLSKRDNFLSRSNDCLKMFKQSCTTEQGKCHLVTNKINNSNDNNNRCTCMSMEERQWLFLPSYLFKRKNTKTSSTWGMNILCKWRLPNFYIALLLQGLYSVLLKRKFNHLIKIFLHLFCLFSMT